MSNRACYIVTISAHLFHERVGRLFLAGNGGEGILNEPQEQLYPLRGTEHCTGVRRRGHPSEETQGDPRVILEGGHL